MKILKYTFFFALVAACLTNCKDDDEVTIPELVAGFTQTIEDDRGTVRFINTSENAQTYTWDFGDGTTSSEINPIKQYAESGTYTVQMTASNESGQTESFSDQITVQVIKEVTISSFDFDDTNVNYSASTFNGASFEIVANPDESGSNADASNVGAITNSGAAFEGIFFLLGAPIDLTTEKTIKMNFWSQQPIDVLLKLEKPSGGAVETTASHGGTGWEEIIFTFTSSDQFSIFTLFVDGPGTTAGTFYFDDIEQIETPEPPFDSGLLTNGDFEAGANPWIVGVDDNTPATVVTEDGNTYYSSGEITNPDPNAPFNVNVSQKLQLEQGKTYVLTFDAWSDRSRSIIAGIGRSGGDFANVTETVAITDTRATYTVTLTASNFGEADNRVLFDLNGEAGVVNIDNVSLVEGDNTGGGGGSSDVDEFCNTSVLHFGGDPGSEILVSIYNISADAMRIEVTSANDDAVDALVLPAGEWNPVPGFNVAPNDDDADGTWVAEFFFPEGAPDNVELYFLWSKVSFEGNWLSHDRAPEAAKRFATVEFNATCDTGGGGGETFDSGLLTNGDFEAGAEPWIVGVDDNVPATVVTMDGNTYYSSGDITNPDANAPFNVNVSQKLALTDGTSYTLTFDAWSDRTRDIVVGIGRSGNPDFANVTQSVEITDTRSTYTVTLTASGFGEADNRVLFDLNGEAGVVNIDNVSLKEDTGTNCYKRRF